MKSRHMDPETWLRATGNAEIDEAELERLIEARAAARTARDFAEADRIRDQLAAEGVILQGPARQDPLAPCGVVTLRVFTASRTAELGRALWLIGDCAESLADYDAASDWGGRKLADSAPDGPDVFLSYAGEDEARARDLATALEQRGLSVFWDGEIPPGQTWHSYIGEALTNARCVVVGWSRHSVASQWVLEDASEGRDRRVLVPVLFEAVQPPFGFRAIQAANLLEWRAGRSSPAFDGLLRAVQKIVGGQTRFGHGA